MKTPLNIRTNGLRAKAKHRFGLTLEEVTAYRSQHCEICGVKAKRMCIDHQHNGRANFRGVLCQQCNVRLGWYEKQKDNIKDYLNKEIRLSQNN